MFLERTPITFTSFWGRVPRTRCTNTSRDPSGVYSGLISILEKTKQNCNFVNPTRCLLSPAKAERKKRHHRDYVEEFLQMQKASLLLPLLLKHVTQSCVYNTQITKISASSCHAFQAQGLKMEFLLSRKLQTSSQRVWRGLLRCTSNSFSQWQLRQVSKSLQERKGKWGRGVWKNAEESAIIRKRLTSALFDNL